MATLGTGDRFLAILLLIGASLLLLPVLYSVLVCAAVVAVVTINLRRNSTYWERRNVPSCTEHGLLGTFLNGQANGLDYDREMFRRFGRTYGKYTIGLQEVVTMDLGLLKEVFVKEAFDHFEATAISRREAASQKFSLAANQLSTTTGDQWKRIRTSMSPPFTSAKLRRVAPIIEDSANALSERIGQLVDRRQEVPLGKLMNLASLDMIARSFFGLDIHAFDSAEEPEFAVKARELSQQNIKVIFAMVLFPYTIERVRTIFGIDLLLTSRLKYFRDILERLYEERTADPQASEKYNDLYQLLLSATAENGTTPKHITKVELLAQYIGFLIGGSDSTARLLQFALYHVAKLPDVQRQLQEEIDSVVGESDHVTYEHLAQLTYLSQVVQETLRICPPITRSGRICTAAVTIKGIPFEEGTMVTVPIYEVNHNPDFYPEPVKFDPGRFSADNKGSRDPLSFATFGHGPRSCIGVRVAELDARMTLAVLLRHYRFRAGKNSPDLPLPVEIEGGFMLKPVHDLFVVAERR